MGKSRVSACTCGLLEILNDRRVLGENAFTKTEIDCVRHRVKKIKTCLQVQNENGGDLITLSDTRNFNRLNDGGRGGHCRF